MALAPGTPSLRKKKRGKGIVLLAVVLLGAVAIFIYNNQDVLFRHPSASAMPERPTKVRQPAAISVNTPSAPSSGLALPPPQASDAAESPKKKDRSAHPPAAPGAKETAPVQPKPAQEATVEPPAPTRERQFLDVDGLKCTLADKGGVKVQISMRLFFTAPPLRQELLLKREDLRVIVLSVMRTKRLSDIVVEPLRAELRQKINEVLESGSLVDIEFTDFTPVQ